MLKDDEVLGALQTALGEAVAASILSDVPIKYIGRTFVPATDAPNGIFIEEVFLPANQDTTWGDERQYMGAYRLVLHFPNNNEGSSRPLQILKSVCGYFTKYRPLGLVQVVEPPDLKGILEQATETLYPASLRYASFRT